MPLFGYREFVHVLVSILLWNLHYSIHFVVEFALFYTFSPPCVCLNFLVHLFLYVIYLIPSRLIYIWINNFMFTVVLMV